MKSSNLIRGCIYLPGGMNLNDFDFSPLPGLPAFREPRRQKLAKPVSGKGHSAESVARETAQLKGRTAKARRPSPQFKGRKHAK